MPFTTSGNSPMYYEVHGDGDPLLLIAGLGSHSESWMTIMGQLSTRFKTIVFDNRGCGRSFVPCNEYSISDMADDTIHLLDSLDISCTNVVGHSMGGYIAQDLAIRFPHRVNKLVLANTSFASSPRNNALFQDFHKQLMISRDYEAWIRNWGYWLFSPRCFERSDFLETFVKNVVNSPLRQSTEGFIGQVNAIAKFDAQVRVGSIKADTLVMAGGNDILITPKEARSLAGMIPNCKYFEFSEAGHSVHIEEPGLFIDRVCDHFRS